MATRMLHAKLVREGFRVNVKVVERIYREERRDIVRSPVRCATGSSNHWRRSEELPVVAPLVRAPLATVERLRRTKRKKIPREGREGAWCPIAPNQRWSLDFTSDALANGRKFRTAKLKDDCTRE